MTTQADSDPIISATGQLRGRGSDRYRSVVFLSHSEREAVLAGKIVLVKCPWGDHHTSTPYKQVHAFTDSQGRQKFNHSNYYGETTPPETDS